MTGQPALLSPGHASQLLDQVIHERVLEAIDFPKLRRIEEHLALELARLGDLRDDEVIETAREMTRRALFRIVEAGAWHAGDASIRHRLRRSTEI